MSEIATDPTILGLHFDPAADPEWPRVETAAINYRVADFLKRHPPFNAIDDADLLELAARGRVRFYEPNQYILWQGEPHRLQLFVIQQGTVSLWDEAGDAARLRDVRGTGDMLGVERYNGAANCLCSVRSESDVVVYAFPEADFDSCVMKYPSAAQYVAAEGRVTADYQPTGERRAPQRTFLHDLVGAHAPETCPPETSIREAARQMLATSSDALAILDDSKRSRGVVTIDALLQWLAHGEGDVHQAVERVLTRPPTFVAPDTSVADAVLAMEGVQAGALAITSTGTADAGLQAIVTAAELGRLFGEQPSAILRGIRTAASTAELRALNRRARAFTLEYLTDAGAVEWLAKLAFTADVALVTRVLELARLEHDAICWCVSGAAGRAESLPGVAPQLVAIARDANGVAAVSEGVTRLMDLLLECDYLPELEHAFALAFYVATVDEWRARYRGWIQDPVRQEMYRARTLFDLRVVHGDRSLWTSVDTAVTGDVDRDFVHVLANDCLANLPPLTFYQDAVIDRGGERHATFQLGHSALQPLVDVGRVFGIAGGHALGRSTLERFEMARALLPEDEAIFREAADALKVVLWQQGRVGIGQGTSGEELPPSLLSRHDRQLLKGGFRAILRLIEFTGDRGWIDRL
jgi:CBS domain-containing protein